MARAMASKAKANRVYVYQATEPITNKYKILQQLGQPGQFGLAKMVEHMETKKKSAVKIIDKNKFRGGGNYSDLLKDMANEINVLKKMKHPNIIKLEEVFETKDELYLVQELCSGGELFDRITEKGTYSEKDAADVIQQILTGIAHIHSKDIVHADLKPDNFLFLTPEDDAQLKIIDFGMAKRIPRDKGFLRGMCGTPYYTAPEVLKGNYHRSADCWSVGVVMFVMLFGYPPFYVDPAKYGNKENEMIYKKIRKGFVPITKKGYGRHFPAGYECSDDAKDLMKWLLRKDVAKRYTALQALDHKWFKYASKKPTISAQVSSSIQKFTQSNKFRTAMAVLWRDNMGPDQIATIKKEFKNMDKDGDGEITLDEFQKFMDETGSNKSKAEVAALFKSMDVDGDQKLSINELLVNVTNHQMQEVPERIYKLFKKLDIDGDGQLTVEEVKGALAKSSDSEWFATLEYNIEDMLKAADKDGDGKLDYSEFVTALTNKNSDDDLKEDEEDDDAGAASLIASMKKINAQRKGTQLKI